MYDLRLLVKYSNLKHIFACAWCKYNSLVMHGLQWFISLSLSALEERTNSFYQSIFQAAENSSWSGGRDEVECV